MRSSRHNLELLIRVREVPSDYVFDLWPTLSLNSCLTCNFGDSIAVCAWHWKLFVIFFLSRLRINWTCAAFFSTHLIFHTSENGKTKLELKNFLSTTFFRLVFLFTFREFQETFNFKSKRLKQLWPPVSAFYFQVVPWISDNNWQQSLDIPRIYTVVLALHVSTTCWRACAIAMLHRRSFPKRLRQWMQQLGWSMSIHFQHFRQFLWSVFTVHGYLVNDRSQKLLKDRQLEEKFAENLREHSLPRPDWSNDENLFLRSDVMRISCK